MSNPLGNYTSTHEVYHGWKSPPNVRGTMDIIFVCVTTVFLCVYSAIHLNLPPPGEKQRYQFLRKAKWVVTAILAPELALSVAWTQFAEARALLAELRNIHQEARNKSFAAQDSDEDLPDANILDLTYAFYAVMGGFRIMADNDSDLEVANVNRDSLVVMPSGLVKFARAGVWWDIDHSTIVDKSKADNLAKTLVVLQLTWMCAQCTARAVSGLPMTLLELHTFIHAICAATMFGIWFKKPLNVQEAMTKTISPRHKPIYEEMIREAQSTQVEIDDWSTHQSEVPLTDRRANFGFATIPFNTNYTRFDIFLQNFGAVLEQTPIGDIVGQNSKLLKEPVFLSAIFLVQAAYGGIHLTAWSFAFPTPLERWAWRGASICIASFAPLVSLLGRSLSYVDPKNMARSVSYMALALLSAASILYLCSRIYLVVEALISLRAVPVGVYEAVPWANYIPHV